MTSFADVPDDIILEWCNFWDYRTLINMSKTHGRVYQLCYIQKGRIIPT